LRENTLNSRDAMKAPKHQFFDLSISDTQLEPETQKERIAIASSLGYANVATPYQAPADRLSL
jgi:hypothetical protein